MPPFSQKKNPARNSKKGKLAGSTSRPDGPSLVEPRFELRIFDDFESMVRSCDSLIAEFHEYYRSLHEENANLFGFVSVMHRVEFTKRVNSIVTENLIGQKTTVIYAPVVDHETSDEQEERRLKLLVAFDHTKRASHILALSLLLSLLSRKAIQRLVDKHA